MSGVPLWPCVHESLELRIGHRVLINFKCMKDDFVFRNFILKQLRRGNFKDFLKSRDVGFVDSHLECACGDEDHWTG